MMKRVQLIVSFVLASSALSGCYGHESPQTQDGQSHWLRRCSSSNVCGDDELCACGVCTKPCASDAACGSASSCFDVGTGSSCEQAPAGVERVCLSTCQSNQSCQSTDEALACVDRACMAAPDHDAGQVATNDASVITGKAGSNAAAGATVAGAGGSGGTSGSAGTGGGTPTKPTSVSPLPKQVSVRYSLENDRIVGQVTSNFTLYTMTCQTPIGVQKYGGQAHEPLRDDRPPSFDNPGHYLDGNFVPPDHNEGCDILSCVPYPTPDHIVVRDTYEYVKTGTRAPPPDAVDAPASVDVIERMPLSGRLWLSLPYYESDDCRADQFAIEGELVIPVPEDGVCCSVGTAECGSESALGSWSDSLEHCVPMLGSSLHPYVQSNDPRGCAVLGQTWSASCSDPDAGT